MLVVVLVFDFFPNHHIFANGHFQAQRDDECVHFVEFAVLGAIDHSVAEDFQSFFEVSEKVCINYAFIAE